ncbi:MAG: hypothetical protein JRF46_04415 [Deltaproteobacteria bacterium]|nr:hypothetical protein [Deltaproteobacteria bacterium]
MINRPEIKHYVIRLQGLSQLGIMSRIFLLGRHSKWEHSVGLYFLASEILRSDKLEKAGLEIHEPSFKAAALLHGIGHFPISYPSELATIYMYKRDKRKCKGLIQGFKEIQRIVCRNCNKGCWEEILEEERAGEIVRWLSSAIMLNAKKWFRRQRTFKLHEILRYLLCEKVAGYHLLWDLDLIDYTQRDIFYLGTAQVRLNLKHLFSNIGLRPQEKPKRVRFPDEWNAIKALSRYLNESVYRHPSVIAAECCFGKAVGEMVFSGEVSLKELQSMSDEALLQRVDKKERVSLGNRRNSNLLLDDIRSKRIERYVYIDTAFFRNISPGLRAETDLVEESFENWTSYFKNKGIILRIEIVDRDYDISRVDILWDPRSRKASSFLEVLEKLEKELSFTHESFKQSIAEWLFGKEESPLIDYQRYYSLVYSAMDRLFGRKKNAQRILTFFFLDEEEEFQDWLIWNELRGYEDYDRSDWIKELTMIFLEYPEKFKSHIREETIRNLPVNHGESNELRAYLKACESLCDSETWGQAMPSLHLRGSHKCEIDLVVLSKLKRRRYQVALHEYSRSSSTAKKRNDQEKLRNLRKLLNSRFRTGLEVVLRYNGKDFA